MDRVKPSIKLTRGLISDMFDQCNRLYFNGSVERPIKIETFTPHKKTLGMVRPVWSAKHHKTKAILHISNRYRWTEQTLRHVVVHEMIHLAIEDYKEPLTFVQRLPFIGHWFIKEHDERFVAMMNDLNQRYGLDIKVRFRARSTIDVNAGVAYLGGILCL